MKNIIKKVLPDSILDMIRRYRMRNTLNRFYNFDKQKFKNGAFLFQNSMSEKHLRSKITFHYHSIEKGLSNVNFRTGFGERALNELFNSMEEYVEKDYNVNDIRFQTGLSTIKSYIERHKELNFSVDAIEKKYSKIEQYMNFEEIIGGVKKYTKDDIYNNKFDYNYFASSRKSVRDFSDEPVDLSKINKALQVATTTPSVCNRQAWEVYVIDKGTLLNDLLKLQGGLSGYGNNMDKLIMVTTDNEYFKGPQERNQGYIDGGLFSMNLLFGLHSEGLATCMLNANLSLKSEKEVRRKLNVSNTENIILFIGIGNYPLTYQSPISYRDGYKNFTKYFN